LDQKDQSWFLKTEWGEGLGWVSAYFLDLFKSLPQERVVLAVKEQGVKTPVVAERVA
jgi:hypothetical protein